MFHWLSEQWLDPSNYNFWSCAYGETLFAALKVLVLLAVLRLVWPKIWKHFECDVEAPANCHRRGYRVGTTGHKACGAHHPDRHDKTVSPTTAEDILREHTKSQSP
jgi:hypothetical protein